MASKKPAPDKAPKAKSAPKKAAPKTAPKASAKAPAKAPAKSSPKPPAMQTLKAPSKAKAAPVQLTPFLERQRQRLLTLKDTLLDSMNGVARDTLRTEGETSAFGMHQADAGSDAYDRDFALGLLSQEQDSLYEIDQALKRVEQGGYGMCEMSNKPIPKARLEALPFARFTVECQAEIEKRDRYSKYRQQPVSLFGSNDEDGDGDDEDTSTDSKD